MRARIAATGPLRWSAVMDEALYGPGGFYSRGGGAGRTRDFLTSPELGPLFGAVIARYIDEAWVACGRPDVWVVIEAGAGQGTLAQAILEARPACRSALRYIAVEISEPLRARAAERVGGWAEVRADLPRTPRRGVVLANELLDNLPFDVYERTAAGWAEVRVGPGLEEVRLPALPDASAELDRLVAGAPPGARVPRQLAARRWLRDALAVVAEGRVLVIDYARTTAEMATAGSWLRTYRKGGPGRSPLDALGDHDITADVAIDQLGLVRPPTQVSSQAAWLDAHGMLALERAAAEAWQRNARRPDWEALSARSRVAEAATLRDLSGMGGFLTVEWTLVPKGGGQSTDK